MRKVYLAAPFQWLDRMKVCAAELRNLGYEVTSRWLYDQDKGEASDLTAPDGSSRIDDEAKLALAVGYAVRDMRNIIASDTVVEFNPGKALVRNTRLAEFTQCRSHLGGGWYGPEKT